MVSTLYHLQLSVKRFCLPRFSGFPLNALPDDRSLDALLPPTVLQPNRYRLPLLPFPAHLPTTYTRALPTAAYHLTSGLPRFGTDWTVRTAALISARITFYLCPYIAGWSYATSGNAVYLTLRAGARCAYIRRPLLLCSTRCLYSIPR